MVDGRPGWSGRRSGPSSRTRCRRAAGRARGIAPRPSGSALRHVVGRARPRIACVRRSRCGRGRCRCAASSPTRRSPSSRSRPATGGRTATAGRARCRPTRTGARVAESEAEHPCCERRPGRKRARTSVLASASARSPQGDEVRELVASAARLARSRSSSGHSSHASEPAGRVRARADRRAPPARRRSRRGSARLPAVRGAGGRSAPSRRAQAEDADDAAVELELGDRARRRRCRPGSTPAATAWVYGSAATRAWPRQLDAFSVGEHARGGQAADACGASAKRRGGARRHPAVGRRPSYLRAFAQKPAGRR